MVCSMPGFPVLHYLPESAQTDVHWVDDAIQPSHPLSHHALLCSVFPSIGVFSNELALSIRRPKYWSFSLSLSNEYSQLVFFRINWFDLLVLQMNLKSLLQHQFKSINSSGINFFMVQLWHAYMIIENTIAWVYRPLSAKWFLCFLIFCVYLS